MLSLRQVQMVVGRLLKEHEDHLRDEYDKILNEKLTGLWWFLLFLFIMTATGLKKIVYWLNAYSRQLDNI